MNSDTLIALTTAFGACGRGFAATETGSEKGPFGFGAKGPKGATNGRNRHIPASPGSAAPVGPGRPPALIGVCARYAAAAAR